MKYNKILISLTAFALFTGCVKPTDEVNTTDNNAVVYDEQPAVVYEDSAPIVYADPAVSNSGGVVYGQDTTTVNNSGVVYGGQDTAVITTESYDPVTTTTSSGGGGGSYTDPYAVTGATGGGGGDIYNDPYATGSVGGGTTYTPPVDNTYSTEASYSGGSGGGGGGVQLQVAALRDYYAAQEMKNSLSLAPKYSAYIKKGAMNKVIVTGFSSRSEAKALASRQFPGAFIVSGSAPSNSSYGSSNTGGGYTPSYNTSHNSTPANNSNGIGVQIGAFSSQSAARDAAQSAGGGQYTAIVKTVNVRGKTLYKAILIGFATQQEARAAIASGRFGGGFLVTNIY